MLHNGASSPASSNTGFLQPPGPSPKGYIGSQNGYRDMSELNTYLVVPTFRIDTSESIRLTLKRGEWTTSLDLKYV
jgi:hypothetical protein